MTIRGAALLLALPVAAALASDTSTGKNDRCLTDALASPASQALIPGGVTLIGSDRFYAEEGPARRVAVGAFEIDRFEVTNARFALFVAATGYVTRAEREGGAVFEPPSALGAGWWRLDQSATWRTPQGVGSAANPAAPVVQVTADDARAYARWLGRDLPNEAEWEHAARGGLVAADYSWGDAPPEKGSPRANIWQGVFPAIDTGADGHKGLAPVGCFEANGFGLHDVAGNAWELTDTYWSSNSAVIKGGSWLCAANYCARYRPAARQAADLTLGTDHIGFRTIKRYREH